MIGYQLQKYRKKSHTVNAYPVDEDGYILKEDGSSAFALKGDYIIVSPQEVKTIVKRLDFESEYQKVNGDYVELDYDEMIQTIYQQVMALNDKIMAMENNFNDLQKFGILKKRK